MAGTLAEVKTSLYSAYGLDQACTEIEVNPIKVPSDMGSRCFSTKQIFGGATGALTS
jgi:hypothetical protein